MSEYFRVLKRIEGDQEERERPERGTRTAQRAGHQATTDTGARGSSEASVPTFAPVPTSGPFAALFENVRVLTSGRPLRCLVFAGVSAAEPVSAVVAGLADHLESRGVDVLRAELTEGAGRALIRRHRRELSDGGDPLQINLQGRDWDSDFSDWLHGASGGPDIALIEGRPLVQSIDAALLARAGDGLVIVAEAEVTPREALQTTVERARAAGCRTLGIVMYGTVNRMPRWLQRLFARPRTALEE